VPPSPDRGIVETDFQSAKELPDPHADSRSAGSASAAAASFPICPRPSQRSRRRAHAIGSRSGRAVAAQRSRGAGRAPPFCGIYICKPCSEPQVISKGVIIPEGGDFR
jgi:hypothetical protein